MKKTRKLVLNKETVRRMDDSQLRGANGGLARLTFGMDCPTSNCLTLGQYCPTHDCKLTLTICIPI